MKSRTNQYKFLPGVFLALKISPVASQIVQRYDAADGDLSSPFPDIILIILIITVVVVACFLVYLLCMTYSHCPVAKALQRHAEETARRQRSWYYNDAFLTSDQISRRQSCSVSIPGSARRVRDDSVVNYQLCHDYYDTVSPFSGGRSSRVLSNPDEYTSLPGISPLVRTLQLSLDAPPPYHEVVSHNSPAPNRSIRTEV